MKITEFTTPIYQVSPDNRENVPPNHKLICWANSEYLNEWIVSEVSFEHQENGDIDVCFLTNTNSKGYFDEPLNYLWFPLPQMEVTQTFKVVDLK